MDMTLQATNNNELTAFTVEERQRISDLAKAAKSESTRRAYNWEFHAFKKWCDGRGFSALPASPATVAAYVAELVQNKKSASMINQAVAAIKTAHKYMHLPSPTSDDDLKEVISGARRQLGVAPKKKAAVSPIILRAMVDKLDLRTLRGLRDRAVLLLGFAGAFRRSELAALNLSDIEATQDETGRRAFIITVRRSKTDQDGQGMEKAIFTAVREKKLDPVRALEEYIAAAGIESGALFRRIRRGDKIQSARLTGESIATIVKDAAAAARIVLDISGHSLRAGFITTALASGASERAVMNQSGHRSVMVMRGYQRRVDVLKDNAAAGLL